MKKQIIGILISIITGAWLSAQAFSPNVPLNTLKAAEEAGLDLSKPVTQQVAIAQSEIVRVGIGNNSFSSYNYKTIGIYGTAPLDIYQNGVWVKQVPANNTVNVAINPDYSYSLKLDNGEELGQLTGIIKFTASGGCLGVKGLYRAGKPALYHGYFDIMQVANSAQFNLVNKLPVEVYLRGVVPNEMPVSFGLEALKAQSVAARNYVLSPRTKASPNYDVVDSVASQVYFGANTEKELSNKAVAQTEGLVALYDWDLILALYSSTAGGYTESYSHAFSDPQSGNFPAPEKPFLKAKPDMLSQHSLKSEQAASDFYKDKPTSYDIRSPYYRWSREWSAEELKQNLQSSLVSQSSTGFVKPKFNKEDVLDDIEEVKVLRRGDSGKIIEMEIVTKSQTYKLFKELVIRRTLTKDGKALPSANVVFENIHDEDGKLATIKAFGGGFGHGVGMSQFGAGFMGAELHKPFDNILQHYYTGIIIGTKPVIISSETAQQQVTQSFYANKKFANLVIDNKFQLSKLNVNINGTNHSFNLPTSIFGGNRCARINISDYINKGKNTIIFTYPKEETGRKAVRLFVELVEKDDSGNIW